MSVAMQPASSEIQSPIIFRGKTDDRLIIVGAPGYTLRPDEAGYNHALHAQYDPEAVRVEEQLTSIDGVDEAHLFLYGAFLFLHEAPSPYEIRAAADASRLPLNPTPEQLKAVNHVLRIATAASAILTKRVTALQGGYPVVVEGDPTSKEGAPDTEDAETLLANEPFKGTLTTEAEGTTDSTENTHGATSETEIPTALVSSSPVPRPAAVIPQSINTEYS